MMKKLFAFQKEGVQFLLTNTRCLLADEVGLGKTVQCIIALQLLNAKSVLIVCPACMRLTWQNEFNNWATKDFNNTVKLRIVSYAHIQKKLNAEKIGGQKWDVIIADESQNLKSISAKQTKHFIFEIAQKHTGYLWLLSATPATRYAGDYFPQLSIIEPGKWGKFGDFCSDYCEKKQSFFSPRGFEYYGFKNSVVLHEKIKHIMLRRNRKTAEITMPKRIYGEVCFTADKKIVAAELEIDLKEVTECIRSNLPIPAHIAEVRRAIGLAKVDDVADWLEDHYEPLVIFAWHRDVISALSEALVKAGKNHCNIWGNNSDKERQFSIDQFEKGDVNVIIISIAAAGVGISLPRAESCVFIELPWSPALYEQAIGRIDRISTKHKSINIYDVICTNIQLDFHVKNILNKKEKGMSLVVGDRML